MEKPISCDLHDYLEIACLFKYRIKLELVNGEIITGKALTTSVSANKEEQLIIEQINNGEQIAVLSNQIVRMQVLNPNARFSSINFI